MPLENLLVEIRSVTFNMQSMCFTSALQRFFGSNCCDMLCTGPERLRCLSQIWCTDLTQTWLSFFQQTKAAAFQRALCGGGRRGGGHGSLVSLLGCVLSYMVAILCYLFYYTLPPRSSGKQTYLLPLLSSQQTWEVGVAGREKISPKYLRKLCWDLNPGLPGACLSLYPWCHLGFLLHYLLIITLYYYCLIISLCNRLLKTIVHYPRIRLDINNFKIKPYYSQTQVKKKMSLCTEKQNVSEKAT